ncbi:MAG TPA: hypothetical protein VNX21_09810, partial [Candidatus Thermoplasmatota archaeon]|nr:hypothetical protein [Candidatus Thermoplasmatota archaeon]
MPCTNRRMHGTRVRRGMHVHRLVVASLLALPLLAPLAAADHAQPLDSMSITFDHRGGNSWWVEARVTVHVANPDDGFISEVLARTESSPTWHRLELRSWGNWAGSFHVPSGERV